MRLMPLLLLLACDRTAPDPADPPPPPPTTAGDTADTDTPIDSGSPPSSTPTACVVEQDIATGVLVDAWRSPSGTLYAVAGGSPPRVRAADGTWTLDPAAPWLLDVHGLTDDEVWATGGGEVWRRELDGTWTATGAPGVGRLAGLHVAAPDDVVALRIDDVTTGAWDYYGQPSVDVAVIRWDGAAWTEDALPAVPGPVYGMAVLPDGTELLAADGQLRTVGPAAAPIPVPPELYVRDVVTAPDGTIVAFGSGELAIGDVNGLVLHDPGLFVDEWVDVYAAAADDIWISGTWWELGLTPWAVVAHWDGIGWTHVVVDHPAGELRLAGGDGEIFAVGGYDHELALVGDVGGLSLDREVWGLGGMTELAVDDVTGQAWAIGYADAYGVSDGTAWTIAPLPDSTVDPDDLAVSGGRAVLLKHNDAMYVFEGGALTLTPTPDTFFYGLAGADGVLFAAGTPNDPTDDGVTLLRDAGAGLGWETVDTSGLPPVRYVEAAWADGPDDLWLALDLGGDGGAIAHWSGGAWTVPIVGLEEPPDWLARLVDGQLYFNQVPARGPTNLWVWDGAVATRVPDAPEDVRAAWLHPDGTWFATALDTAGTPYRVLLQRDPGGAWVEVLSHTGPDLVGFDDTVWTAADATSWTTTTCPTTR